MLQIMKIRNCLKLGDLTARDLKKKAKKKKKQIQATVDWSLL